MGVALPYIMSGEPSCACVVLPMGDLCVHLRSSEWVRDKSIGQWAD